MRACFSLKGASVLAAASFGLVAIHLAAGQTERPAGVGVVIRLDQRLDALVPQGAAIERVADGFVFLEGPVWRSADSRLFYSDLRGNAIYQWTAEEGVRDVSKPFFTGERTGLRGVGPNGIALDRDGRLLACVYGSRSVVRIEKDGTRTTLADSFQGKRLNSPNDLVVARDGTVYFMDPSFGLEGMDNSPLRKQTVTGVYRLRPNGELTLLTGEQERPNGLVLSPDETILYVANSGGPPEALTNVGWGEDGRTLFITGRTALYRIRLSARGATD